MLHLGFFFFFFFYGREMSINMVIMCVGSKLVFKEINENMHEQI